MRSTSQSSARPPISSANSSGTKAKARPRRTISSAAPATTARAGPTFPTRSSSWTTSPPPAQFGLYYYYHTMAKTLAVMNVEEFTDAKGVKHDWKTDMFQAIAKRQQPDGSCKNDTDRWMEGDPNLVTGYALMALSHCQP